ncbi:cell envelope integrity TolA C-terminal domain-containing protein [Erwinia sp. P7711]|uniref:cell envelope integrity TolA C-terminal domain-containing protein n=1 Tax=Erwinia sp. P7711 TaxID=3141451 RepID=UPI003186EB81
MLLLALAGCQTPDAGDHPKPPPAGEGEMRAYAEKVCVKPEAGVSHSDCIYLSELQYGIQRNFYGAKQYAGRECSLTIRYNEKGRYDVLSTAGDELLCKKAWSVVSSAENLPPPPQSIPKTMVLIFKPAG